MRMRERHGARLVTAAGIVTTDLERVDYFAFLQIIILLFFQGGPPRYMPTSNSTNSVTMIDETMQNAVAVIPNHRYDGTNSPPLGRSPSSRRRSMIRGKTFDDDSTISKSARVREYASNDKSYGSSYDGATKSTTLGVMGETPQYRVTQKCYIIIYSADFSLVQFIQDVSGNRNLLLLKSWKIVWSTLKDYWQHCAINDQEVCFRYFFRFVQLVPLVSCCLGQVAVFHEDENEDDENIEYCV